VNYSLTLKRYTCKCPIKSQVGEKLEANKEYENVTKQLPESFYEKHENSNIEVFKCASQAFSAEGQKNNFGSYCLLASLASMIGLTAFYFIKGKESVRSLFSLINERFQIANPPRPKNKEKEIYDDFVKKPSEKPKEEIIPVEEELNLASYEMALKHDLRNFIQYYWSLIKTKQLFIFTFYTSKDHNLPIAKFVVFILFISIPFGFTALFFSDKIMKAIYNDKGNTNAATHIPNILFSSLCCLVTYSLVKYFALNDREMSKISSEDNAENRKDLCQKALKIIKIKLYIMFAASILIIFLCWYYVSTFCAVFKNSQGNYFINLLFVFIIFNAWPFFSSLFAPIFRIKSLKNGLSERMYKFSQIIAYL